MRDYSAFQQLKIRLLEIVPIGRDNFHVLVGATAMLGYLAWTRYRRRPFSIVDAVALALATGVVLELPDLWDDVGLYGEPHFGKSLKDIGLTLIAPSVVAAGLALRGQLRRLRGREGR